jgi:hypothetical protein
MGASMSRLPRLRVLGQPGLRYVANGEIGNESFGGWRKWKRARKWVEREIAGHRELLRTVGQA